MTAKVVSVAGIHVEVATPEEGGGGEIPAATITTAGLVKQAVPVADVPVVPVTDIQSAQDAIAAMGTTLAELMQSLRNSGALGTSDS